MLPRGNREMAIDLGRGCSDPTSGTSVQPLDHGILASLIGGGCEDSTEICIAQLGGELCPSRFAACQGNRIIVTIHLRTSTTHDQLGYRPSPSKVAVGGIASTPPLVRPSSAFRSLAGRSWINANVERATHNVTDPQETLSTVQ